MKRFDFARSLRTLAMVAAIWPMVGAATRPASELTVEVEGLRSQKGMIRVCLTSDEHHFPDCDSDPAAYRKSVSSTTPQFALHGLAPGTYALLVMHDENGNAKLDSFAGIPREGVGFSRNPRLRFGPPSFEAVTFRIDKAEAYQSVKMKYFL
jgi:uncharacterized protein (DUF2141 family)